MQVTVSTDWLAEHLDQVRILDGSWYLPTDNRDPHAEYLKNHIEGALFFDIDAVSDQSSDLPHTMPDAAQFAGAVSRLGISNQDRVVVYDGAGLFSAARVWWMFRMMGHSDIFILNGGLPKWQDEGRATTAVVKTPAPGNFEAVADTRKLATPENLLNTTDQIADARAPARFAGTAPEPRAGLRSGHIPNSKNVFFKTLLNEDGTLKSAEALAQVFETAGIDPMKPVITSCGSGVTAAVLDLALTHLGAKDTRLYDGSWSEWGARTDLPIETS